MYLTSHFEETRTGLLHALIEENPLGVLVHGAAAGLDADHLPFELARGEGDLGYLRAHVARGNPVWTHADGSEVLVVFRGGDAYVSPTWYPSKHETQRQVPTWNYRVVHAHGRLRVLDDERFVRGLVARLTRRHESGLPVPWRMGDAPADYIDGLLRQIVGIEVQIERLVGKFKLSQNREPRDRLAAADTLMQRGDLGMGQAMKDA
jgi:transcriptional regulator